MNMNTIILGIKIIVMFTNQFEIIPMGLHVLHVICVIDSIMRMADRLPGARHRVLPHVILWQNSRSGPGYTVRLFHTYTAKERLV